MATPAGSGSSKGGKSVSSPCHTAVQAQPLAMLGLGPFAVPEARRSICVRGGARQARTARTRPCATPVRTSEAAYPALVADDLAFLLTRLVQRVHCRCRGRARWRARLLWCPACRGGVRCEQGPQPPRTQPPRAFVLGDGRLRGDVDEGLGDEPALVGLDQRVAGDDGGGVTDLHQHVHPLQAGLHRQHASHGHAPDADGGAHRDAAGHGELENRLAKEVGDAGGEGCGKWEMREVGDAGRGRW